MDIEKIVRDYLQDVIHLSLGTSKDNKPWVCEVHFAWDDNLNLYFRSITSRRHSQEIAANPFVAGNIVRQHALGEIPLGVYFEGTAEKLEADEDCRQAAELLKARQHIEKDILAEAEQPDGPQFYRITVRNWYVFGKLEGERPQKYTLEWNGGRRAEG